MSNNKSKLREENTMDIGRVGNDYSKYYSNENIGSSKNVTTPKKEAEDVGNNKNMLSALQKKYPNLSLTSGTGINWNDNNKTNNVIIHPSILAEMENDEKAAKEYTQRLSDIGAAFKISDAVAAAGGGKVTYRCQYIDENGKIWGGAIVEFKDTLNEKLRKEAEENMQKRIDKSRETAGEKMKALEERIAEALKDGGGRVEFNNEEMLTMIKEAKRIGLDTKIDIKV